MRTLALVAMLLSAASVHSLRADEIEDARHLAEAGKFDEARTLLDKLLAAQPKNAAAHAAKGELALRRKNLNDAVADLERAIALEPNTSRYHLLLGQASGALAANASLFSKPGLAAKTRREFEKALELDPKSRDAAGALVTFYLVAPGLLGGGTDKALKVAADFRSNDFLFATMLETQAYEHDKRWDEAEKSYRSVLEKQPEHMGTLVRLGSMFINSGQYDRAFAHFIALSEKQPESLGWKFNLGRTAAMSGQRLDEGLAALQACLAGADVKGNPSRISVLFQLGKLHEKRGDATAARAAYEEILKIDPKSRQAAEALKNVK